MTNDTEQVCRVCGSISPHLMDGALIGHPVAYFRCEVCGYIQTEEPFWLDEAYRDPINASDTGILVRNLHNRGVVAIVLALLRQAEGRVLDYAGGYGILVRLLRDFGIDAYWADGYCDNKLAAGFESRPGMSFDLLTAFEVFEHLKDPAGDLDAMIALSPNVLISTELAPPKITSQDDWWYFGKEHGQHIGFFTRTSLERLAARSGKRLLSDGQSYHLFTDAPITPALFRSALRLQRFIMPVLKRRHTTRTYSDHALMASSKAS